MADKIGYYTLYKRTATMMDVLCYREDFDMFLGPIPTVMISLEFDPHEKEEFIVSFQVLGPAEPDNLEFSSVLLHALKESPPKDRKTLRKVLNEHLEHIVSGNKLVQMGRERYKANSKRQLVKEGAKS